MMNKNEAEIIFNDQESAKTFYNKYNRSEAVLAN